MLQPHPACACGGDKRVLGDAGRAYAEICGGRGRDSCLLCVFKRLAATTESLVCCSFKRSRRASLDVLLRKDASRCIQNPSLDAFIGGHRRSHHRMQVSTRVDMGRYVGQQLHWPGLGVLKCQRRSRINKVPCTRYKSTRETQLLII